jgi:ferredoxin-NADP reductase
VAVQREPRGRGGSVLLHDKVPVGSTLRFGGPRNNFRLTPSERHLFIAGGIGITPLLPMLRQTDMLGLEWQLLYLGRGRNRLAYLDELQRYGSRVTVHCADEVGRADLDAWRPTDPRTRVFACGPERLLDAVEAWGSLGGGFPAKTERFAAAGGEMTRPQSRFEVVAARTGATTTVARDETIVAALRRVGVDILTSCGQGVCGTCETAVIEGHPDHRDSLLDDRERAESQCIFPCVSRCRDRTLTLDI